MSHAFDPRRDPRVAAVRTDGQPYDAASVDAALRKLATILGWGSGEVPLGGIVPSGARVLVKPNWVVHRNDGPWGLDPLVTHSALIRAVVKAALDTRLAELVVGDAPLQRCDFDALMAATGTGEWGAALAAREPRFAGVHDFRRTRSIMEDGIRRASEDQQPLDDFVLFDLAEHSLLEPITRDRPDFRVTRYDPSYMARTHRQGRHQYLVARAVMDADVVINLPKLKTHRKAGITCALKNLIGINGNKEFLPHHRVGGSAAGGDCYPGRSRTKRALEFVFDRQNSTRSPRAMRAWNEIGRVFGFGLRLQGDVLGIDGAWSGNDTIWRTCLDLNRVLVYGRPDGTLADEPQRRVLHITDAIIGGQGDGPLAAEPLPLGLLLGSTSAAAMDYVGSRLLGYDAAQIPITTHAFDEFAWPLTFFGSGDVRLVGDLGEGPADALIDPLDLPYSVDYPVGWAAASAAAVAADNREGAPARTG